jgi:hypothetical protein
MSRAPSNQLTARGETLGKSAGLVVRLLGTWWASLVVPARALAAHNVPNPGERDVAIAEVVLVILLLSGILLASFWPKRRRTRLRKRRFRLK